MPKPDKDITGTKDRPEKTTDKIPHEYQRKNDTFQPVQLSTVLTEVSDARWPGTEGESADATPR